MCLNKTYSRVQVDKDSLHVSCKNGLKQGDVLLPLLFNFALECAIRRVYADQEGLKLIGAHQLLLYRAFHNVFHDYKHLL